MRKLYLSFCLACMVASGIASAEGEKGLPSTKREAAAEWREDGLERVKVQGLDVVFARPGASLAPYDSVLLRPVTVSFRHDWGRSSMAGSAYRIRPEDTRRIKDRLAVLVREELDRELGSGGYRLVADPGPDVLEVGLAIRDLHIAAPDVRSSYPVDTYALSAGEMTLVAELRDSVSGDIAMRIYDRAIAHEHPWPRRITNVENEAEARAMSRAWAKALRRQLDLARGVQAAK